MAHIFMLRPLSLTAVICKVAWHGMAQRGLDRHVAECIRATKRKDTLYRCFFWDFSMLYAWKRRSHDIHFELSRCCWIGSFYHKKLDSVTYKLMCEKQSKMYLKRPLSWKSPNGLWKVKVLWVRYHLMNE